MLPIDLYTDPTDNGLEGYISLDYRACRTCGRGGGGGGDSDYHWPVKKKKKCYNDYRLTDRLSESINSCN